MMGFTIFGGIAATLALGLPIGAGLGLVGLVLLTVYGGGTALAATSIWNTINSFTFSAVPLFLLMGEILLRSGISTKIYNAVAPLFSRVPGKLLHTNIAACAVFGAVSGASMSTAAAIGSAAYPELRDRGYDRGAVVGTLAAGGTLGLLIPPSLSMVLYGALMEVSIGDLFLAGALPGILMAMLFSVVILILVARRPGLTPQQREHHRLADVLLNFARIWPFGILVFSVLGVIYLGIATPTEAAGIGFVTSLIMGFVWGNLTVSTFLEALKSATVSFTSILFVVTGALILAQAIAVLGLPTKIVEAIAGWGLGPLILLLFICGIYVVLGCIFDGVSMMLVTLPVVFPVLIAVGYDPVWLGVLITVLVELGMLTPPVGINLFVVSGITAGEVSVSKAAREAIPFWFVMIAMVGILICFPELALWLPSLR